MQVLDRIAELGETMYRLEHRDNSGFFPAKTCRDLQLCHSVYSLEDGDYDIDPNAGSSKDQIRVHCNFTNQATCIRPKVKKITKDKWKTQVDPRMKIAWYAEDLNNDTKIEYEIDEIQLNYLQLLSNHAQQTFTFRCKNSVAWYDESARSFKKAVKFEGVSGHEFSSKSKSKKAMIKVPYDGCKVKDGAQHDTQFVITSTQASRLPVVDFAAYDLAGELEVEIGEVCFW